MAQQIEKLHDQAIVYHPSVIEARKKVGIEGS